MVLMGIAILSPWGELERGSILSLWGELERGPVPPLGGS